ncbi:MAG: gliding motility-associated C-terminal domain-containing protein [Crocinitomicaceae bacterium]|nr:gliding motility-associated C-terminal domain-containing protein [Crocinitomicaceae bacterium]MDG1776528.1 gliding motility-associated C-terminal domain-containing protein [Crocinitomicaceae bacterium]
MKNVIKIIVVTAGFLTLSGWTFGQSVLMGDEGYLQTNPADCATFGIGSNNFFDDGNGANYSANFNDTTVFCPDLNLGTKMTMTFAINAGFEFDVDGSDSIYVFDGPDVSAPLLGVHNSVTDPMGFAYTASWSNPSGCLTVVFVSDGANEGTGWNANVQCGNQAQPFEPHVEAFINGQGVNVLNPLDTGFVDVCFGDSVLLVATPVFPHSLENTGYGYSQNVNSTISFDWYITDGGTYPDNDSVWFTPPTRNGFIVDVKIEDQFPQIDRVVCKVRVSQLPDFSGTGPIEDTVCLGESTTLVGGVTATDTVGINIPSGTFQLGGSFAGLTYLPDGSGAQYQAPIDISGFPTGSQVSNSQDLNQVCITMEHSYLGDLEIALQCPNGTQVTLLNSYDQAIGFIPGGVSGGGTYMGDPIDDSGGGGPGEGWEYCFSSVFNTFGDWPSETGNTVPAPNFGGNGPSLNPNGIFLPEDDFSSFAGCPINGQWTIIVQDNLGIDDGYIFEWGLYFDPSFFPGANGYQNTVVSENWQNHPTIVSGQSDTALVVQTNTPGYTYYTYEITDDFGCDYDTTVALYTLPQPVIFNDSIACDLSYYVNGVQSYSGGVWSAADTAITFSPSNNIDNPDIYTSTPGIYTISYTDNACNTVVTAEVEFLPYPFTYFSDTVLCNGIVYSLTAPDDNSYATSFVWNDGTIGQTINVDSPGTYTVSMSNACHTTQESTFVNYELCFIDVPNVISLAEGSQNPLWYVEANGLSKFKLTITNRWGNVVFECDNAASACTWDGKDKSGKEVVEGTYFYIIDAVIAGGDDLQEHGFIQVIH